MSVSVVTVVPFSQRWDSSAFSWRSTRQSACKSAHGAKGLGFGLCPTDVSFVFTQTLPSQSFYPLFLIFRLAVRFHSPGLRTLVYTAASVHGLHSLSNLSVLLVHSPASSLHQAGAWGHCLGTEPELSVSDRDADEWFWARPELAGSLRFLNSAALWKGRGPRGR